METAPNFTGKGDNTGPGQVWTFPASPAHLFRCKNLDAECFRQRRLSLRPHSLRVYLDGVRIYNRVNLNDGFHINSSQYVHSELCVTPGRRLRIVGNNKFVTVTNSTFSTAGVFRWRRWPRTSPFQTASSTTPMDVNQDALQAQSGLNITFSGDYEECDWTHLDRIDSTRRSGGSSNASGRGVRNIAFNGIRATVVAEGRQHERSRGRKSFVRAKPDLIVLNGVAVAFSRILVSGCTRTLRRWRHGSGSKPGGARAGRRVLRDRHTPSYGIYAAMCAV